MTRKQKNIRDYIIGLVVVCVLIVAIIIVGKNPEEAKEDEEEVVTNIVSVEGWSITDLAIGDIKQVTYTLKDEEPVVFEKKVNAWILASDAKFPLSEDSFKEQFLQKYIDGQVFDVVEGYDNLADYGIEDPEAIIEVIDKDGATRTYKIGAYNGVIRAYYLYHVEEDVLYTASGDFLYICRDDIYDFAMVDNFPSFSINELDRMIMKNGQKKVELVYFADGYETDPFNSCKWFIKSPFSFYRACDAQDVSDNFEELFTGLGFCGKVDYYADDEELESYGLATSDRYYEIVYKDSETNESKDSSNSYSRVNVKVLFGNYNEEEDAYYARIILTTGFEIDDELSRSINLIDRAKADAVLNIDPVDYIYPFTLYVKMTEFDGGGFTVSKADGTEYKIEYDAIYGEESSTIIEEEHALLNGKEVDIDKFKDSYYNFIKIYVNKGIYTQEEIVDCEPTYVLKYDRVVDDFYGDAVIEYREYDSTYYQVSINGYVDSLVVRRDVDKAVKSLEELAK